MVCTNSMNNFVLLSRSQFCIILSIVVTTNYKNCRYHDNSIAKENIFRQSTLFTSIAVPSTAAITRSFSWCQLLIFTHMLCFYLPRRLFTCITSGRLCTDTMFYSVNISGYWPLSVWSDLSLHGLKRVALNFMVFSPSFPIPSSNIRFTSMRTAGLFSLFISSLSNTSLYSLSVLLLVLLLFFYLTLCYPIVLHSFASVVMHHSYLYSAAEVRLRIYLLFAMDCCYALSFLLCFLPGDFDLVHFNQYCPLQLYYSTLVQCVSLH